MTGLLSQFMREEYEKLQIWKKGHQIIGLDPSIWRRDDYGNRIRYSDYGNRQSEFGWEKDHYPIPDALGGSDHISNLRPLHHKVNASLGGLLASALVRR